MFRSIVMPLAIGASMAFGSAALADGVTKNPQLYKESPTDRSTAVNEDSVMPGAQESQLRYNNTEKIKKGVREESVKPEAPINKERYKAAPESPSRPDMPESTR